MLKIINSPDCLSKIFTVGDTPGVSEVSKIIISMGYTKVDRIDRFSEFSVKGDILDIPYNDDFAYRLMFFGDEIEAIKIIKLGNFATTDKIKSCNVSPVANNQNVFNFKSKINVENQDIKVEFLLNMDFRGVYLRTAPTQHLILKPGRGDGNYITKFRGDTKLGSLVWHDKYGIGRFVGVKKMALGNTTHKYVMLQYDRKAIVYVPFNQLGLLYNYHGKAKRLDKV